MCERCKALDAHTKHTEEDANVTKAVATALETLFQEIALNKACSFCAMEEMIGSLIGTYMVNTHLSPFAMVELTHILARRAVSQLVAGDVKQFSAMNMKTGEKIDISSKLKH